MFEAWKRKFPDMSIIPEKEEIPSEAERSGISLLLMRLRDLDEIIRSLYEYRELSKGIFWFTCEFTGDGEADSSESEIIYLLIPCNYDGDLEGRVIFNSRNGTSFTHKESWKELVSNKKELRKHSWNYYPRGRVEMFNGKTRIYLNPMILDCPNFKGILKRKFNLNDVYIQVIPDNSRHYACYGQDSSIK